MTFPQKKSKWRANHLSKLGIFYDNTPMTLSEFMSMLKEETGQKEPFTINLSDENNHLINFMKKYWDFSFDFDIRRTGGKRNTDDLKEATKKKIERGITAAEKCLKELQKKDLPEFQMSENRTEPKRLEMYFRLKFNLLDFLTFYLDISKRWDYPSPREGKFSFLFMLFSKICFLRPQPGETFLETVQLKNQKVHRIPDVRFITQSTSKTVAVTEVKQENALIKKEKHKKNNKEGAPLESTKPEGTPPGSAPIGSPKPEDTKPNGAQPGNAIPKGTTKGSAPPGGTPAGSTKPKGAQPEGTPQRGAPQGGAKPKSAPLGGTPKGRTPPGGALTGGTNPKGAMTGDAKPKCSPPGGTPQRGSLQGRAPTRGTPPGSAPLEGTPQGVEPPRGAPQGGTQPGGSPQGGAPTEGPPQGDAPSGGKSPESFIFQKVAEVHLCQHGVELLIEKEKSVFRTGVAGFLCIGTKVFFTYLKMTENHYSHLKANGEASETDNAKIYYTEPFDFMQADDREKIFNPFFRLGLLQAEN